MANRDKLTGRSKELAGKVTGDEDLEAEGRTQHAKGETRETIEDAKAKVAGAWDAAKEAVTGGGSEAQEAEGAADTAQTEGGPKDG